MRKKSTNFSVPVTMECSKNGKIIQRKLCKSQI